VEGGKLSGDAGLTTVIMEGLRQQRYEQMIMAMIMTTTTTKMAVSALCAILMRVVPV